MCGISGSGKTTYAKTLENNGFVRLSLDELMWNRYGASYMEQTIERQREVTIPVESELKELLLNEVKCGNNVVVDMCMCKRAQRDAYRSMLSETKAHVELHYCHTDLETLKTRIEKRNKNTGPDAAFVPIHQLEKFNMGFQVPEDDELAVDVTLL